MNTLNRRSFLRTTSTLAGAALVPTWLPSLPPLPVNKPNAIDLAAFCDDEVDGLYQMNKPFIQFPEVGLDLPKPFIYATDSRICVRLPTRQLLNDEPDARLPPAWKIGWTHDACERVWRPWPKARYIDADGSYCFDCDGKGHLPAVSCPECGGHGAKPEIGWHEMMHDGVWPPCLNCMGTGYAGPKCSTCDGQGEGRLPGLQKLGNVFVAAEYHRKVADKLPGAEYSFDFTRLPHGIFGVVMLRFDGGQGLLMPVTDNCAAERIEGR